ncbi:MAG: aspartate/glutamate racemase family protein [Thermodesulfobacteriota bacterium]
MKTVGLIGGMSWESTTLYYQLLNRGIQERLGGLHSAKIIMESVDFHEIETLMRTGQWDKIGEGLAEAARRLERGGADFVLLCTNTIHKVAPRIEAALTVPFLHLIDATGRGIVNQGIERVGLLGTSFTMEEEFYRSRLEQEHNLTVLIPGQEDRDLVNRIIFRELCLGKVRDQSATEYLRIIRELEADGAQGIILGCTEIGMLIRQEQSSVPFFDTTHIHVAAAIEEMLG